MASATSAWVSPAFFPHLGQILSPDLQSSLLPCVLYGCAVVGVDELLHELVARIG